MTTSVVTNLVLVATPFPVTDVAAFTALTNKTTSTMVPGKTLALVGVDGPVTLTANGADGRPLHNGPTAPHLTLTFDVVG
jgi:hypothetical protein